MNKTIKKIGSDFDIKKTSVDWHEYIDFPFDHHVLLLRGYAGRSSGDVFSQGRTGGKAFDDFFGGLDLINRDGFAGVNLELDRHMRL